jgi:hypothetical protein
VHLSKIATAFAQSFASRNRQPRLKYLKRVRDHPYRASLGAVAEYL